MMKKIIRGTGLFVLCLMTAVMPVRAADDPVSLIKDGNDVKVVLSKEAIDDEVHSLHLSLEVDVTKGNLSQDEVSFDWAISDDAYKTQFCEQKDGSLTLDIYTSAKEDIFSAGNDGLTLGVVKLSPAKGSVTVNVAVAGSLETVNGVQELNKSEGSKDASVEVTAGKSSGGKKPGGSHGSEDSNSNNSSSNNNTNNNQTVNNNNAVTNNNANLGLNNNFVQAVPDTVPNSVTSQNKKGQTSQNRTVKKENSDDSQSNAETEITGMEMQEAEDTETAETVHESLPESEAVSTADADNGNDLEENLYMSEGYESESSGMALGVKVFLGILVIAIIAIGAVVAVRFMNKKKEEK